VALFLTPAGVIDRRLGRSFGFALAAGAAMALIARLLGWLTPWVAAPVAVAGYFGVLWIIGGVDEDVRMQVRAFMKRKLQRFARA
jgi:Flp pilus assembly protein TadB